MEFDTDWLRKLQSVNHSLTRGEFVLRLLQCVG